MHGSSLEPDYWVLNTILWIDDTDDETTIQNPLPHLHRRFHTNRKPHRRNPRRRREDERKSGRVRRRRRGRIQRGPLVQPEELHPPALHQRSGRHRTGREDPAAVRRVPALRRARRLLQWHLARLGEAGGGWVCAVVLLLRGGDAD